jgi:hypothetical protein
MPSLGGSVSGRAVYAHVVVAAAVTAGLGPAVTAAPVAWARAAKSGSGASLQGAGSCAYSKHLDGGAY